MLWQIDVSIYHIYSIDSPERNLCPHVIFMISLFFKVIVLCLQRKTHFDVDEIEISRDWLVYHDITCSIFS